ncbi:MAG: tRNA uridine-5-carboxymethylaminomethyl(34) synthesis GTPase MnmE [Clostridiales bacterium]|nr:MAG: tRNA uridine-5-carboxymethylaminomethyl(34) synthesis GTPase MnmE [Clostridiales bacterium]
MDTIVALSTAPITSAIGIVRLSGNSSFEIVEKFFSKPISDVKSHTVSHGKILDTNGNIVDDVLITVFRSPTSYTGENIVEISCHGSPFVLKRVVELAIENGARKASGGEFTKRAFLNGKLDLAQAEAVIDLIEAESERESGISLKNLHGDLSLSIEKLRKNILDICAQILAFIDYPDDDIADVSTETLENSVKEAFNTVTKLKNSYNTGRLIKDGVKTVICGKPNVGKSSLMNRLTGFERSIVTDIAGTTRDIIEEKTLFAGIKLVLSDTAGIHESNDTVEKIGVERAEKKLKEADLIFFVCDAKKDLDENDNRIIEKIKHVDGVKIAVINKSDEGNNFFKLSDFNSTVTVSAKTGEGFDLLEKTVIDNFEYISTQNNDIIMNARQYECICRAFNALKNALDNIKLTPDAIITDLERAVGALGEVTGKTTGEEIIENIFSRFCVGK